MSLHLAEISREVATGAHAVVVLDGAGWHQIGKRLRVPGNISLLRLPPYSPELNPQENMWQYLRQNQLSNRVFADYDAIVTRRRVPDIDSQSARTTEAGGPRGYDGRKKVSGRKRHTLVDTEGALLKACVHPAGIHDPLGGSEAASLRESRRGTELPLEGLSTEFPRIALIGADSAYQGLKAWLAATLGCRLMISKHWRTGLCGVWAAPASSRPRSRAAFTCSSNAGWSSGHWPGLVGTGA